MMTIDRYLQNNGWVCTQHGNTFRGICPIHPDEQHASFTVYPTHAICWHTGTSYDRVGMVHAIEFNGIGTTEAWMKSFRIVEQWDGGTTNEKYQYTPFTQQKKVERAEATREQRLLLTAAMSWFYQQLWSDQGRRGQGYFRRRGVRIEELRFCQQLGYAPASWSPEEDQRWLTTFGEAMHSEVGEDWLRIATSVGLISTAGRLSLRDRVLFFSLDEQGMAVYFQARQVQFDEEKKEFAYLGARTPKVPFTLALPGVHTTMTHTESPFGPAVLAPYGLSAMAWHGPPMELPQHWFHTFLCHRQWHHLIVTDNDTARMDKEGKVFYPGEYHAKRLAGFLDRYGLSWTRILPPREYKDLDTWILKEGIQPYLAKVQACTLSSCMVG